MQAGETCPSVFSVVFSSSFNLFGLPQNRALPGHPKFVTPRWCLGGGARFQRDSTLSAPAVIIGPWCSSLFWHWVPRV